VLKRIEVRELRVENKRGLSLVVGNRKSRGGSEGTAQLEIVVEGCFPSR
jgi:hypothetical protein